MFLAWFSLLSTNWLNKPYLCKSVFLLIKIVWIKFKMEKSLHIQDGSHIRTATIVQFHENPKLF